MDATGSAPRGEIPQPGAFVGDENSTQAAAVALPEVYVEPAATPSIGSSKTPRITLDQQPTVITKVPHTGSASSRARRPQLSVIEFGRALEGTVLDHFELREFIGGGGMGAVFRGIDTRLGRSVAVKVLSRDQHDPETRKRFKNEAQNAARLDHDNIARVYYVGEAQGWSYIVFEFIEGVNVRDLVEEQGPLSVADTLSYTIQLAEALTHAASRDVVHRDIKPSNILITPQGKAKLVDMGLARLHHMQAGEEDLTQSGVTLGTFDYISPEQAHDPRGADVRSDLYSLGCTIFYVLTGRPPFPEGTILAKLMSHNAVIPPDVRTLRPELPPELAKIVEVLLAKRPEDRYQTPQALIEAAYRCAEAAHISVPYLGPVTRATPNEGPPPFWLRNLPWIAPLAVLLLMAVFSDWIFPQREATGTPAPRFNVPMALRPATPSVVKPGPAVEHSPPAVPADARPMSVPPEVEPSAPPEGPPPEPRPMPNPGVVAGPDTTEKASPTPADVDVPKAAPMPTMRDPVATVESPVPAPMPAPTPPMPMPAPANPAERLIVVGAIAKDEAATPAADLAAAVALAAREPGERRTIIELRFDGLRRSAPMRIANQTLTIRAGDSFHPTILFAPEEEKLPRAIPQAMVKVIGGSLDLRDLAIIFAVPQQPSATWALFEIQESDGVEIRNSSITIENAFLGRSPWHSEVAVFDLLAPATNPKMMMKPEEMMARTEISVPIDLWFTIVRGEATMVRAREATPFRLEWQNGLLATTERMIAVGGAPAASQLGGRIDVTLDHVTAAMDKGLLSAQAGGTARHLMPISATFRNCIFLAGSDQPLMDERGYEEAEMLRKKIMVTGRGNLYQATFQSPLELFWRIASIGPKQETIELDFEDWTNQWKDEMMPQRRLIKWQSPPASALAAHKHTKRDYQLKADLNNPARGTAEDKKDAGFDSELLPDPPEGRPASAEPPPASLPAPTGLRPMTVPR